MAKFDAYGGAGYDSAFDDDGYRNYEFDVDLKWGLWYTHRCEWADRGHEDAWDQMRKLWPGDSVTILTAPRKEIMYGRVVITRHDTLDWRAEGRFTSGWDEVYDLANTLGAILVPNHRWMDFFGDIDFDDRAAVQAATERFLVEEENWSPEDAKVAAAENEPTSEEAFVEGIPFSMATMDPGIDHEFEVRAQLFSELVELIDEQEAILCRINRREWNCLCDIWRKPDYKER